MNSEEMQRRIHNGDRAAFGLLYDQYSRTVYARALSSLDYSSEQAKEVVKKVFITVYQDIRAANAPFDVSARIARLTDMESAALLRQSFAQPVAECAQPVAECAQPKAAYAQPVEERPPQTAQTQPKAAYAQPTDLPPFPPDPVQAKRENAAKVMAPDPEQIAGQPQQSEAKNMQHDAPKPQRGRGAKVRDIIVTVLICLLFVAFLWVLAGILMDSGILPVLDLGYSWFNATVYPLFKLGA